MPCDGAVSRAGCPHADRRAARLAGRGALGMLAVVLLEPACNPSGPSQGSESAVSPAAPTAAPAAAAATAAPPASLRLVLNWTAPAGSQAPLWVAYEAGLYREQGLDVELVNVPGTARAIQSMA